MPLHKLTLSIQSHRAAPASSSKNNNRQYSTADLVSSIQEDFLTTVPQDNTLAKQSISKSNVSVLQSENGEKREIQKNDEHLKNYIVEEIKIKIKEKYKEQDIQERCLTDVGVNFNEPYLMNVLITMKKPIQKTKIPVHTLDDISNEIPIEKLRLFVNHGSIFEFKEKESEKIQKFALYSPRMGTCVILTETGTKYTNEMFHHAARSVKNGASKRSTKAGKFTDLTRLAILVTQTKWKNTQEDTLESKLQEYMSTAPEDRVPNKNTPKNITFCLFLTCFCNEPFETDMTKGKAFAECKSCRTKYHNVCLAEHGTTSTKPFVCIPCSPKSNIEWFQNIELVYNKCPFRNFQQAALLYDEEHPEIKISFSNFVKFGTFTQKTICSNKNCSFEEQMSGISVFEMDDTLEWYSNPENKIKILVDGDGDGNGVNDVPSISLLICDSCNEGSLRKKPLQMNNDRQQWYITFNGSPEGTLPMDDSKNLMQLPEIKIDGYTFEPRLIVLQDSANHFVSLIKYKNIWLSYDDHEKKKEIVPCHTSRL